jgi:hypothetical protein
MASHQGNRAADHTVMHAVLSQDGLHRRPPRQHGQVHHTHAAGKEKGGRLIQQHHIQEWAKERVRAATLTTRSGIGGSRRL